MHGLMRIFVSLNLTVWALVGVTLLAIFGTLIPQHLPPQMYLVRFGPRWGSWLLRLGFNDLFHSPLFLGLLSFLLASAVLCTILRWRFTWRRWQRRLELVSAAELRHATVRWQTSSGDSLPPAWPQIGTDWTVRTDPDGTRFALHRRGRIALLGSPLIHVGLVIILIGGLFSYRGAVDFQVTATAGDTFRLPEVDGLRAGSEGNRLRERIRVHTSGAIVVDPGEVRELEEQMNASYRRYTDSLQTAPWAVTIDDLWIDSPAVVASQGGTRHWNTAVSVRDRLGQLLATGVIQVNQPLVVGDYTLYQSNWQNTWPIVEVEIRPTTTDIVGSWPRRLRLPIDTPVTPDWSSRTFRLTTFFSDLRIGADHEFVSVSDELNNPAARIEVFDATGQPIGHAWAFAPHLDDLDHHLSRLPGWRFIFVDAVKVPKTGLQIAHDPGIPWVWTGFALMTTGLALVFYVRHFEDWILLEPGLRLTVAVTGNRPPEVRHERLAKLIANLFGARVTGPSDEAGNRSHPPVPPPSAAPGESAPPSTGNPAST